MPFQCVSFQSSLQTIVYHNQQARTNVFYLQYCKVADEHVSNGTCSGCTWFLCLLDYAHCSFLKQGQKAWYGCWMEGSFKKTDKKCRPKNAVWSIKVFYQILRSNQPHHICIIRIYQQVSWDTLVISSWWESMHHLRFRQWLDALWFCTICVDHGPF